MKWRKSGRSRIGDIKTMNRLFPAADEAALADGQTSTGAEYLVIAALDLPDGSARRSFERAGSDPDDFAAAVRRQHADALRSVGIDGSTDADLDAHIPAPPETPMGAIRGGPSSHELFRNVVDMVRKEKSQLHGAYIVLVAASLAHGTTRRALEAMQVDPERLAAAARTEVDAMNAAALR